MDTYGWAVALNGGTAVIGAPSSDDIASNSGAVYILEASAEPGACNDADLAEPFGTHDLADIGVFVTGFTTGGLVADLNGDTILDLSDIALFVTAFTAGCP